MKLRRSICLALCCLCSCQISARRSGHRGGYAWQQEYQQQVQNTQSVYDAYEATRQFLLEHNPRDKQVMKCIVRRWFYNYAADIDKDAAEELRDQMWNALRSHRYDPKAIPQYKKIVGDEVYAAFAQEIRDNGETEAEMYEEIRDFMMDQDFSSENARDFVFNVYKRVKGQVSEDMRKRMKSFMQEVLIPTLADEAFSYDVSQLPRTLDDLYIARHMANVREETDINAAYQETRACLDQVEVTKEKTKRVLQNIDASSLDYEDKQRLYNLFDTYLDSLEMPISRLPGSFDQAVDFVSTQYTQHKFMNVDTTDETQVYSALRESLSGVDTFFDVTARWVRKLPRLGDKLNRNQTPGVVQSVSKYLQTHGVAELPKEYRDISSRKNLEAEVQRRLDTVNGYLDQIDTEFAKDMPDVDLDAIADQLASARDTLGRLWNDIVIPDNELPQTHKMNGKQVDAIMQNTLSDLFHYIRMWISHMAYRHPREPIAQVADWMNGIVDHPYMHALVDNLKLQSRQFDTWHHEHIAYAYLRMLKAKLENNDALTPENLSKLADTFKDNVIENLPKVNYPQFIISAAQEFDVALDEYLAHQISSAAGMNLTQKSSAYHAVMEAQGDKPSVPSLIKHFHDVLPDQVQSPKFRKEQLYIGYYFENAKMMMQRGIDNARRLDSVHGNLQKIDKKATGFARTAYEGFVDTYNTMVDDYNDRMQRGEIDPVSREAKQKLDKIYAWINKYQDKHNFEKPVVEPQAPMRGPAVQEITRVSDIFELSQDEIFEAVGKMSTKSALAIAEKVKPGQIEQDQQIYAKYYIEAVLDDKEDELTPGMQQQLRGKVNLLAA